MKLWLFLFVLVDLTLVVGCRGAGPKDHDKRHHGDHATVSHRFEDAQKWAARFEDPSRSDWQAPDQVLDWMDLESDDRVADIGSATGYFPVRIAKRVPQGVVYGVDVEHTLVNYLNLRAHREGLANLVSLVCRPDDPSLPEPVDVILIVNTYHHLGDRVDYFTRLLPSLRDGGRIVIVDFKLGEFPVGPGDDHKLPREKVIAELREAGYDLRQTQDLRYQYYLEFLPAG